MTLLRVVVVSGSPSEVASLEQTVKELDTETAKVKAVSNAEMTVYVLGASQEDEARATFQRLFRKTVDQIQAAFHINRTICLKR